jgi:hypothetical protein
MRAWNECIHRFRRGGRLSGAQIELQAVFYSLLDESHSPMKTLVVFASLVVLSSAPALAADRHVPQSSLVKMGLSSMRPLTDQDGLSIRGRAKGQPAGPYANLELILAEISKIGHLRGTVTLIK